MYYIFSLCLSCKPLGPGTCSSGIRPENDTQNDTQLNQDKSDDEITMKNADQRRLYEPADNRLELILSSDKRLKSTPGRVARQSLPSPQSRSQGPKSEEESVENAKITALPTELHEGGASASAVVSASEVGDSFPTEQRTRQKERKKAGHVVQT